ncbi:MAG: hypothetical protein FWE45_04145 [Firmicutes bacterium]|nr:hypothetical protein [Bacillota bacterium]
MTRRRLAIIFFFIALFVLIGFGIWWLVTTTGGHTLEAGRHYYIQRLRPNFFIGSGGRIDLEQNDSSHAVFNNNFTTMTVHFSSGDNFVFQITDSRTRRRVFYADMVGIVGGNLMRFELRADESNIVIRSAIDYDVRIETADRDGEFDIVIRRNDEVLRFSRTLVPLMASLTSEVAA